MFNKFIKNLINVIKKKINYLFFLYLNKDLIYKIYKSNLMLVYVSYLQEFIIFFVFLKKKFWYYYILYQIHKDDIHYLVFRMTPITSFIFIFKYFYWAVPWIFIFELNVLCYLLLCFYKTGSMKYMTAFFYIYLSTWAYLIFFLFERYLSS